jgi:hypothetical protein
VLAFRGGPQTDYATKFIEEVYDRWLNGDSTFEAAVRSAHLKIRDSQTNSPQDRKNDAWALPVVLRHKGVFLEINRPRKPQIFDARDENEAIHRLEQLFDAGDTAEILKQIDESTSGLKDVDEKRRLRAVIPKNTGDLRTTENVLPTVKKILSDEIKMIWRAISSKRSSQ